MEQWSSITIGSSLWSCLPGVAVPFQWCVNVGRLRCDLVCQLFVWMRSFSRDELSTEALEHVYGCYGWAYVKLCRLWWQKVCFQIQCQDATVWLLQQVSSHLYLCRFSNLGWNTWREHFKKYEYHKSGLMPGASIKKKMQKQTDLVDLVCMKHSVNVLGHWREEIRISSLHWSKTNRIYQVHGSSRNPNIHRHTRINIHISCGQREDAFISPIQDRTNDH